MKTTGIVALALAVGVTGCASIASGPTQQIKVESNPPGAKIIVAEKIREKGAAKDAPMIFVKKEDAGVTPATVVIRRRAGAILIEKEGYETAEVPLHQTMNPWVLGNVAMGSLLSTSIDSSTGAMYKFDPDQFVIELKKK
jgi:hypothetical protein